MRVAHIGGVQKAAVRPRAVGHHVEKHSPSRGWYMNLFDCFARRTMSALVTKKAPCRASVEKLQNVDNVPVCKPDRLCVLNGDMLDRGMPV